MKLAVIDLGTNTCNLLIAEINQGRFKILHRSKQLVKLGDGKIKENEISPAASERTLRAFENHKDIINRYEVEKVKAIATSAVRTAKNRINFLDVLSEQNGWVIKVITGEKEADLIFKGVLLAFGKLEHPAVILDIGGGSNEIIVGHNSELLWKESLPTGMSRVINQFKISDPITTEEINKLKAFFERSHKNAHTKGKEYKLKTLIGCSGSFDTVADVLDRVNPGEKQRTIQAISIPDFYRIYYRLIQSTRMERMKLKGMDMVRIDLIVPAVIFIELLVSKLGVKQIFQTDFALREGVLFEEMNQ